MNALPHSIRLDNEITNDHHQSAHPPTKSTNRRRRYEVSLCGTTTTTTNTNSTNSEVLSARVKLKLHHIKTVLPSSPEAVALLKFTPDENNRTESDLSILVDRYVESVSPNSGESNKDVALIPKCLELIAYLGSAKTSNSSSSSSSNGNHLSSTSINQDQQSSRNSSRMNSCGGGGGGNFRNNLMIRVFECLVKIIEQSSESPHFSFFLLQAPLKQVLIY